MIRFPSTALRGIVGSTSEIVEEVAAPLEMREEEKIYVLVGKDVNESELNLKWALNEFRGKKLCLLHVHQPSKRIPIMGTKFSISQLEDHQVTAYYNIERGDMHKLLETYRRICERAGVLVENLYIETDSIEKGIVELITMHNIEKLVMGAASDKLYSKKMVELKSKKAIYVCLKAPLFCHIWFVCRGNLIHTRKGNLNSASTEVLSPPLSPTSNILPVQSSSRRSTSVLGWPNNQLTNSAPYFRRVRSAFSSPDGTVSRSSSISTDANSDAWDIISRRNASVDSCVSSCSSSEVVEDSALVSTARPEGSRNGLESRAIPHSKEHFFASSPRSALVDEAYHNEIASDKLYDMLERTMAEADNSRREAFEESMRRRKAEKLAIEAIRKAKASESSYAEELRRKKETEDALACGKEEMEKLKPQFDEVMKELQFALEQKSSLEFQIKSSDKTVKELEQKIFSAVDLLQRYKKERDELLVEHEHALSLAEELRKKQVEDPSTAHVTQFYLEFSLSEIEEATKNFDLSLKIGGGSYGRIYRGVLRHTHVAIKVLQSHCSKGPSKFEQEVNILSTLRHPNLITLIGACPEAWMLVYEYLPNGSLEDRLSCKDNTPPLPWQTRLRIAAELCSVLVCLHSCKPHSIVHGDLKPENILLDTNHVSKLSDIGFCCLISQDEFSSNNTTICLRPDYPKGTSSYIDPEYLSTGELTRKSDVYSFGIILLRLLTGRTASGIAYDVQSALDKGNLKDLLDPTAGDWPFVLAKQLAHLAVSCCEMKSSKRPDLISEVWRMLEPMRVSSGASEEHSQIPQFFICPIFQEIMREPVVAADGYTYENEAIKGWLDGGSDTSPMTDTKLPHNILVPNHALRSAIQEWLQQS